MISMAPAQDRTAQIVRDPIVDTGHRAWLPNPRLFPTQGRFRKRDLRCSLCQAGLRGHLTCPVLAQKSVSGAASCLTLQEVVFFPAAFGVLARNRLAPSGPKEFRKNADSEK